jgi:hypothetical protein
MKKGHVVRRNRRLFWGDNLVMHRDQVLLRESFYDCLRKSKLNIGELRQSHGFLFFRSKDGKDQLSIIPLAKEALPSAVEMIQLASRLHEEGRTPEIEKEAKALIEKWNLNVQEYRIHIRRKKVKP